MTLKRAALALFFIFVAACSDDNKTSADGPVTTGADARPADAPGPDAGTP